jgi:hypothetical protein
MGGQNQGQEVPNLEYLLVAYQEKKEVLPESRHE